MQIKNNYQLEWEVSTRFGLTVDKGIEFLTVIWESLMKSMNIQKLLSWNMMREKGKIWIRYDR